MSALRGDTGGRSHRVLLACEHAVSPRSGRAAVISAGQRHLDYAGFVVRHRYVLCWHRAAKWLAVAPTPTSRSGQARTWPTPIKHGRCKRTNQRSVGQGAVAVQLRACVYLVPPQPAPNTLGGSMIGSERAQENLHCVRTNLEVLAARLRHRQIMKKRFRDGNVNCLAPIDHWHVVAVWSLKDDM